MGLFNIFDNVGTRKNTEKFTATTVGTIVGLSKIRVNKMYLPIAEYEVNGSTYQVRVSNAIAKKMEKESSAEYQMVEARPSIGFVGQVTKIQGSKVKVMYNPEKPQESVVVE